MKKKASLHNGHWERIRRRVIETPISNLTDTDILEGLLQFIFRRADTNEIAKGMLHKFGNVVTMMDANFDDFADIDGLGETSKNKLLMLFKCIEYLRMEEARLLYSRPNSTANAFDLVKHHFVNLDSEMLMVHYLNNTYNVVHSEVISTSSHGLEVYMDYEQICSKAKLHRASKVIMSHNHPTGDVLPSKADYHCTCKLYAMLRQNNILLLDHIIVSNKGYFSFFNSRILSYIADLYEKVIRYTRDTLQESKLFHIPR